MIRRVSVYRRFSGHDVPSLITTNVARHEPLFSDENAAKALVLTLKEAAAETKVTVFAYVIMPDHLHIIAGPTERSSHGQFMRLVKGRFAHRWNRLHDGHGAIWQARFHEKALRTERALLAAIDYVHHNPVAAGLVTMPDEYRWSSAKTCIPAELPAGASG